VLVSRGPGRTLYRLFMGRAIGAVRSMYRGGKWGRRSVRTPIVQPVWTISLNDDESKPSKPDATMIGVSRGETSNWGRKTGTSKIFVGWDGGVKGLVVLMIGEFASVKKTVGS